MKETKVTGGVELISGESALASFLFISPKQILQRITLTSLRVSCQPDYFLHYAQFPQLDHKPVETTESLISKPV